MITSAWQCKTSVVKSEESFNVSSHVRIFQRTTASQNNAENPLSGYRAKTFKQIITCTLKKIYRNNTFP